MYRVRRMKHTRNVTNVIVIIAKLALAPSCWFGMLWITRLARDYDLTDGKTGLSVWHCHMDLCCYHDRRSFNRSALAPSIWVREKELDP